MVDVREVKVVVASLLVIVVVFDLAIALVKEIDLKH